MVRGDCRGLENYVVSIILVVSVIFFFPSSSASQPENITSEPAAPGRIIFITGSCSAGKSSIAKIIADRLDAKYFAFDEYVLPIVLKKFITKHYGKLLSKLLSGIVIRNFFSAVNFLSEKTKHKFQKKFLADLQAGLAVEPTTRMYKEVKKLVEQGYDVLVESPLFLLQGVSFLESLKVFKDTNIIYVLAYCPLDSLIEHLEKRNSSKLKKNHRELDWVIGNYVEYLEPSRELRGKHFLERISGHHVHNLVEKYAQKQFKKKRMYLSDEIKQGVLAKFPKQSMYYVYPRFKYDIIINTGVYNPSQGAEMVLKFQQAKG